MPLEMWSQGLWWAMTLLQWREGSESMQVPLRPRGAGRKTRQRTACVGGTKAMAASAVA